jgi:hypothetical protein
MQEAGPDERQVLLRDDVIWAGAPDFSVEGRASVSLVLAREGCSFHEWA